MCILHRNAISQEGYKRFHPLRRFFLLGIIILPITIFLGTTHRLFASHIDTTQKLISIPMNTEVITYHNDTFRSGLNANESILTTSNINSSQFGKRVTYPVDGQVYAQPLFLPNVHIKGNIHNVVFVATEHASVYAFDADQTIAIAPLWKTSFLNSTVTTVLAADLFDKYSNEDISPEIGITGTPVIDPTTDVLYVDAMTKANGSQYIHQLHALDIKTGSEKPGSPITIQANVPGTGDGTSGPAGPAGPTGPLATPQYGYISNTIAQTVPTGGNVTFNYSSTTSGISLTSLSAITVSVTGVYRFVFSVSGTAPDQFVLSLNGVQVNQMEERGSQPSSGRGILSLAAGNILTLTNTSGAPVALLTTNGTTQTNASLLIERLGDDIS